MTLGSQDWERHYHTWTMEWDKDFITISVDRQEVLRLDLSVADPVRTSWPNPFTNGKKWLGFKGRGTGEPFMIKRINISIYFPVSIGDGLLLKLGAWNFDRL